MVSIDAQTIAATTADSLADLLRREAGIQISRSGGPGQSGGIFIRGASSQQTVVLVDGVRVGSATLGSVAMESLPLSDIDHVEVLRGPGSSLYGADAVGGVVQIFTRRGAPGTHVDGHVGVGGYGSLDAAGGLRGAQGPLSYAATLSHESSHGVSALRAGDPFGNYNPDRDGYALDTAQLHLGLAAAPGQQLGLTLVHTRLNAQYDSSQFLPPDYLQDPSPNFRNRQQTTVAGLDWRGTLAAGLVGSARASSSIDDARSGGDAVDRFRTARRDVMAQVAWQSGALGQFVGALEHLEDRATSSSYVSAVQRRTDAVVGALTGEAGRWQWQGDLRHDDSSDYGGVTTGRVGGAWLVAPGLRLRALAGTTFRAPGFNDLYYPGYGVAALRPERGRSLETGLSWQGHRAQAALTVYRNRVRDLIGYQSDPAGCPADPAYAFGCAGNTGRALLQGATISAARSLGALALKAQIDFLDAHDEDTGARLPRRAAHQATLGAAWTQGAWTWAADLLRLGTRPDAGVTLAAETTLDLAATWRLTPAWQLRAKLLDATNVDTQPARDYQAPRRQGWLVLHYAPPV